MNWFRSLFRRKTSDIGSPLMSPSFEHTPPKVVVAKEPEPLPVVVDERPYLCSECEKEWAPTTMDLVTQVKKRHVIITVCSICGSLNSRPTVSTKVEREKAIDTMLKHLNGLRA